MSQKEEIFEQLESAIDNRWPMRPVKKTQFLNIGHEKNLKIDEPSQILESVEHLEKFPRGATGFAIIPKLLDGFVCIDLDFTDEALKEEVWALFKIYERKDLFLRTGNPKKIGQLWFRTYDAVPFCSYTGVDIITTQKRCDAIGYYKGDESIRYEWPYKSFFNHTPDDLPIITQVLVNNVLKVINKFYGDDTKVGSKNAGSRHDQIIELASLGINANNRVRDIIGTIMESDPFKSISKERNAVGETANAISWAMSNAVKNYVDIRISKDVPDETTYNIPLTPPSVEAKSFFDMVYKAIRRNQRIDNKRMAMVSTLSICSWILSLGVRFEDVCPNLMILLIAPSGSGKSTSTKAIKEIIKLEKKLKQSYFGQDIRTDSAIFSSVQESPVGYYNLDEASKLFKSMGNKGGHVQNLPEILSQLYSDYKESDPPQALAKLKSESYGVNIGAKINLLAYSTEAFWNDFSEDNYTQGLGRRLFIVTSSVTPVEKVDFEYSPEFFKDNEKEFIKMFMSTYIGGEDLYEEVNISEYKIVESITNDKGIKITKHHEFCKRPKIRHRLVADADTKKYLSGKFIKESNAFRKKASSSGSVIQEYVANSRAEFIKKFAIIHAVAGKRMVPVEFEKGEQVQVKVNTILRQDSIEWGKQMFDYYMIGSTMENIDSIFGKDDIIEKNSEIIDNVIDKMDELGLTKLKKSDKFFKNFFRRKGGSKYRNTILKEMIAKGLLTVDGDIDYFGCEITVVDNES